jgi:hypothetical protein
LRNAWVAEQFAAARFEISGRDRSLGRVRHLLIHRSAKWGKNPLLNVLKNLLPNHLESIHVAGNEWDPPIPICDVLRLATDRLKKLGLFFDQKIADCIHSDFYLPPSLETLVLDFQARREFGGTLETIVTAPLPNLKTVELWQISPDSIEVMRRYPTFAGKSRSCWSRSQIAFRSGHVPQLDRF